MEPAAGLFILVLILYSVLLLYYRKGYLKLYRKQRHKFSETDDMNIDVIVPFRNEDNHLPHLISCLRNQRYNPELVRFILVNDHSEDASLATAQNETSNDERFLLLSLPRELSGKKSAVRYALGFCSGEAVVFTDADCRFEKNWLLCLISSFKQNQADLLMGPVFFTHEKNFFSQFSAVEMISLQAVTGGSAYYGNAVLSNGANLMANREVLCNHLELYKSNIASGDDMFLLSSFKKNKNLVVSYVNNENACVFSAPPIGMHEFMHQKLRWAAKTTKLNDSRITRDALIIFVTNLLVLLAGILGLFYFRFLVVFLTMWFIKFIVDHSVASLVVKLNRLKTKLNNMIIFELVNFVYVPCVAMLSLLVDFKWKNRTYKK